MDIEPRSAIIEDPLTGLPNRVALVATLSSALEHHRRMDRPMAVLSLDLDEFRQINDTSGYLAGDLVLRQIAKRLVDAVRVEDLVARIGGDEFAIVLENADSAFADAMARRIIERCARPIRVLNQELFVQISIGIIATTGDETVDHLLSGADNALHAAKERGTSRHGFFEPSTWLSAVEKSRIRTDLRGAVQRSELTIHYQPIVDIPTHQLSGFEALVRWNHPTRGLLGPDEFIGHAEKTGVIVSLGAWVLRTACTQIAQWREASGKDLNLAVNLSPRQLLDPGLIEEVKAALHDANLGPDALVLEITESAMVEDTDETIEVITSLKRLGVGLAIDDFGCGYSSISYLRRLPVDQLKVDRTFINGLIENREDQAIVSTVINLGHSLGLSVVAEGVETAQECEKLYEMGCDRAQGYAWRRPADAEDVSSWLALLEGEVALL